MTDQKILSVLRNILVERYSTDELRNCCFDLSVDYDDLPGEGKASKARELVSFLDRRNRLADLVHIGRQQRPDIVWPSLNAPSSSQPSVAELISTTWGARGPVAENILESPENSVLMLGTSNFRIVFGDLFPFYDWLNKGTERIIGLLFLNPHSPHAAARERKGVLRSGKDKIMSAIEHAYQENGSNQRFVPAIYDGPYRYSARGVDIGYGKKTMQSTVYIITSSHQRGMNAGFFISLTPADHPGAYSYYRSELLDIWETALANPPGHGISVVVRWPDAASLMDELEQRTQELRVQTGIQATAHKLFLPHQLHLTIASLCRTQKKVTGAPLQIGSEDPVNGLPAHFAEFMTDAIKSLVDIIEDHFTLTFDTLMLDKSSSIVLATQQNSETPSTKAVSTFHDCLIELAERYNQQFPHERWNQHVVNSPDFRFRPKYNKFPPHITIGKMFDYSHGLPMLLTGVQQSISIPPISFTASRASAVHYAYRTFWRCIGEMTIPFNKPYTPDPIEVVRSLSL